MLNCFANGKFGGQDYNDYKNESKEEIFSDIYESKHYHRFRKFQKYVKILMC